MKPRYAVITSAVLTALVILFTLPYIMNNLNSPLIPKATLTKTTTARRG